MAASVSFDSPLGDIAALCCAAAAHEHGLKWIEEPLSPDDYWGYAALRRTAADSRPSPSAA
jgi:L-alanine-DL-glutamate epimerase-like enolase superfamily enzyme